MKIIKKSMFLLLGVFVLCMFSQATFAQEKAQPKKQQQVRTLKKGDKIRSTNGQRKVIDRKAKPGQRPAIQKNQQTRPAARPNNTKPKVRPVPGNKANIKRPTPNNARPIEKRPKPVIQNKATEGRLRGIKQGSMANRPKAMSVQNQNAMRTGHAKLKGMRTKLNAAKAKVAKEKAANPNSTDVKAKEVRIRQAEAKIKAMEQELANQRKTISNISQQ